MGLVQITLFFSLILTLINTGLCIKCYTCSSIRDNRCGDNFLVPNTEARDCDGTCYRYRGERWDGSVKIVEVSHGCRQLVKDYCEETRYNGIDIKACYCNDNFCNNNYCRNNHCNSSEVINRNDNYCNNNYCNSGEVIKSSLFLVPLLSVLYLLYYSQTCRTVTCIKQEARPVNELSPKNPAMQF